MRHGAGAEGCDAEQQHGHECSKFLHTHFVLVSTGKVVRDRSAHHCQCLRLPARLGEGGIREARPQPTADRTCGGHAQNQDDDVFSHDDLSC